MSHPLAPSSGWSKTRRRQPVGVWLSPDLPFLFADMVKPWNTICGWDILRPTVRESADVVVEPRHPDEGSYPPQFSYSTIEPTPHASDYRHVTVKIADGRGVGTAHHELGHALGFADHGTASAETATGYRYTKVCDDPQDPRYDGDYNGIMAYCRREPFNREDATMLEAAGLRIAGSPVPYEIRPTPPPPPPARRPFWQRLLGLLRGRRTVATSLPAEDLVCGPPVSTR